MNNKSNKKNREKSISVLLISKTKVKVPNSNLEN